MKIDYKKFLRKEVMIIHKSGMKDFGKLTLFKEHKKWEGCKGYIYCLNGNPYKMRSIKKVVEI